MCYAARRLTPLCPRHPGLLCEALRRPFSKLGYNQLVAIVESEWNMSESKRKNYDPNFIVRIFNQGRLAWRLIGDRRVPLWLKGLPLLTVAYLIWPLDIISELLLPLLGPLVALDDLGIILVGLVTFIGLAPKHVVDEHERAIRGDTSSGWQVEDAPAEETPDGTPPMVEGYYTIVEDEES